MRRRTGPRRIGERYLLQFPGGLERLAEVAPGETPDGEPVLRPVLFDEPLPRAVLPGGEWLVEADERLLRDWTGTYWSVQIAPGGRGLGSGGEPIPAAARVEFSRHAPSGERFAYRATSLRQPDDLGDAELVDLLRHAWYALETDAEERLRRSDRSTPQKVEL